MSIHPTAIVEDGAGLGDVEIGPFCHVGVGAKLHDGVVLERHVVIEGDVEIGANTRVSPFAVLGGPPQHLGCKGEGSRLVIGAGNIIREHVTMNRGTTAGGGVTRVGDKGFFMTGSHVAHDCQVGDNVIFANGVAVGGHVVIGDHAFLGGLCALHQHCRVGDHAFVGGCAAVTKDIIPFASAVGNHARLVGLNIVGLKRRGFERKTLHDLRAAYRILFFGDDVFKNRLEVVREKYAASAEVMRMLSFVDAGKSRPLMTPDQDG
ncbi:acyl-ACP--UDP-N-acetylglucosamine O-acyltransferase [Hyphococcus luteus]|uniref:Acyl-[acyl-carrier-protein]--UDP-N-acetylglucosamine O-acyltransferase n=1 Tax=Hyphococcus luteus TaxID=2058213 RepID=A0A2S7JYQ7_9PROT|nr:acyl-ACP--UDP-N-acetylglucosamine O-acyltransferase [Marinicaulis flavus]PQA85383.1 acyl-[acyl-carrier-protein]--UDP-N-acetylglucosamine O-acyltransferase [Marinicaulis flavus]